VSFTDIANQRLLPSVKPHLDELSWNVDGDTLLRMSPPDDLDGIFLLMARRGLDPALVSKLLDVFPERSLERALIAWDVLHSSLLGPGETALIHRVALEVAPLKALGATTKAAVPQDRVGGLFDAVRPSGSAAPLLDDFKSVPSLGGLFALSLLHKTLEDTDPFLNITVAYAKQLAMSHLPSLALAFLQILWDRFASQPALDELVDAALDHGLFYAIPPLVEDDDVSLRRQAYVAIRGALASYNVVGATALVSAFEEDLPAFRKSATRQLVLACTELDMLMDRKVHPDTFSGIQKIAPPESTWLYAARIRDSVAMQTKSHLAGPLLEQSISRFGNDVHLWRSAGRHPDARAELLALLSREIRYVSHDPEVWRVLASFTPAMTAIEADIEQRLTSQLESALA
jgi:hypothetical protein